MGFCRPASKKAPASSGSLGTAPSVPSSPFVGAVGRRGGRGLDMHKARARVCVRGRSFLLTGASRSRGRARACSSSWARHGGGRTGARRTCLTCSQNDNPLYQHFFSSERDSVVMSHFILHASLDLVDEMQWKMPATYIKTVDKCVCRVRERLREERLILTVSQGLPGARVCVCAGDFLFSLTLCASTTTSTSQPTSHTAACASCFCTRPRTRMQCGSSSPRCTNCT